jgi:hypothetical protein
MRAHRVIAPLAVAVLGIGAGAQAPPGIDELMTRVGGRIAEYYRRAQSVMCTEKSTVQPIGWNFSPQGFPRTVESELRVEADAADGDTPPEAKVVRDIRKINGRAPRERDHKQREACTDPNPLSTEPLSFLLPAHRSEYRFTSAGTARERERGALVIEFASTSRAVKLELKEDPKGRPDCFSWSGDVPVKGRVWVDATTYEVLRVEQRFGGPVDVKVSSKIQQRHRLDNWVVIERNDLTIRYKTVAFKEPDEVMLLPESIEELLVVRGGLESSRRTQIFSDYRRFLTAGRLVK